MKKIICMLMSFTIMSSMISMVYARNYTGTFDESLYAENRSRISADMTENELLTAYNDSIAVYVEGRRVNFDQPPVIQNGRTLVPIRATCEAMDITVDWDASQQRVVLTGGGSKFEMYIGQSRYYTENYSGSVYNYFDVPPQIINGRTLLPIRVIAEFFGYRVSWDASANSVIIEGTPKISFKNYIGVWDTYSMHYAQSVDARIRITDVDTVSKILYVDYKVDEDSQSMWSFNDKLTIDDYPYKSIRLYYRETTLSNGKAALVTDAFELLENDKVSIILDEAGNFGLGNAGGTYIMRNF